LGEAARVIRPVAASMAKRPCALPPVIDQASVSSTLGSAASTSTTVVPAAVFSLTERTSGAPPLVVISGARLVRPRKVRVPSANWNSSTRETRSPTVVLSMPRSSTTRTVNGPTTVIV
jgi:hypothetical protein